MTENFHFTCYYIRVEIQKLRIEDNPWIILEYKNRKILYI